MQSAWHTKKYPISRDAIILLLLSGLAIHDFLATGSLKIGFVSLTYLRVVLIITFPFLIWPQIKLHRRDMIGRIIAVFMVYGLFRIAGNIKPAFNLYCTMITFFLLYISVENVSQMRKCVNVLAVINIFFCIVGLLEVVTGYHFGDNMYGVGTMGSDHTAVGMYYNMNDFSAFLAVCIFFLLLSDLGPVIKMIFFVIALMIMICNQSIICLLGLISYAPVVYLLKKKKNRVLRTIIVGITVIFLFLPIMLMVRSSSIGTRSYMYKYGIRNCLMHWAFGNGIGNYAKGMYEVGFDQSYYANLTDPHNLFFELAGQFGIIWAILLIILLIRMLYFFGRRLDEKGGIYLFGLVYIIPFVGLSSSTCMEKNYIYLALLVTLAYYRIYSFDMDKCISKRLNGLEFLADQLAEMKKQKGYE